jgi:hypothetical protein
MLSCGVQRDFEVPMASQCPACGRRNPADAYYCFYDGRLLSSDGRQGPVQVGSLPFATPFCFPDGQTCVNFNQLALACDRRWAEARALLVDGIWAAFFKGIGRLDLSAAATLAAVETDLDQALSQLLEKLPADPDALRPPKLALESTEENLGQLMPGADLAFELVIRNQGMFLLHGTVSSNCDWLVFGARPELSRKAFQTRNVCAIEVRAIGSKLRAGRQPLEGEFFVETNGGTVTIPVRAEVPINPFPKGIHANDSLAGASSPREIALKAKEHPHEAAVLFAQGAVKAWYASNGWTYPIEGSEGSGKGAIQQFFEALGLVKAPRLEINTESLTLKGKIGARLSQRVTVRTDEAKPVYAQAWSDADWVTFGPNTYRGNKVEIAVEVTVPPRPGETVQARVTIQGNGKQQFVVPVSVKVEKGPIPLPKKAARPAEKDEPPETPAAAMPSHADVAASWLPWAAWFAAGFLVAIFFSSLLLGAFFVVRRML